MARVTTQDLMNAIMEIKVNLSSIETTLTGKDGDNGLCGDVKRLREMHHELDKRQGITARMVYALIGAIGIGGATSLGIGFGM